MEKIKKTFHEQIAENLIEQLKKGTAPWQKPWQPGDPLLTLPNNPTTGKNYKGINVLLGFSTLLLDGGLCHKRRFLLVS